MAATAQPTRVAVVGTGNVGSSFAFALVLSGLASEIVLVDANADRAEGEAMDLAHAVPFSRPARVWAGAYGDCAGAAITVVAAGAAQKPGQSRRDLVRRNDAIFGDVIPRVAEANPEGILLVATNPVDALAYRAWRLSGLPPERVIGSGTILDTARFRSLLAAHFDVDPRSVHAFVVGEHGDSEVAVWSSASVAGMPLDEFAEAVGRRYDAATREDILRRTRDAAYEIIARKGATHYGVAAGLLRIVEAIVRNQRTVLSVSSLVRDWPRVDGVYLSLPAVVGRGGVERVLHPRLADDEGEALRRSATAIRETLEELTPLAAAPDA